MNSSSVGEREWSGWFQLIERLGLLCTTMVIRNRHTLTHTPHWVPLIPSQEHDTKAAVYKDSLRVEIK